MMLNERNILWDWGAACHQQDVGTQQELAHYVQEGLDEIAMISHEAKQDLRRLTGDPSFYGYVSGDPERVRVEVQALYERLQKYQPKAGGDLSYVLEPIESVGMGQKQRIRLAREVLFWGHGVCLDWVLLFAACVFQAHIYPLIIVTGDHAFLGYWLRESDAMQSGRVVLSGPEIQQLFEMQYLKVLNTTRIPPADDGRHMPFEKAEEEAETHLPYALFAVDLRAAREEGIDSLLPLRPWAKNHTLSPAETFQARPELNAIRKWWKDEDSYGVLALVGMGGSGKTALVHRFLEEVPNSNVGTPKIAACEDLPIPDALFVWSFEKRPSVMQFVTDLYNYLTDEQQDEAEVYEKLLEALSRWSGRRVLLILDGLEILQSALEKGQDEGIFGTLFGDEGKLLTNLLTWTVDGQKAIRVLVTSRFELTDLLSYKGMGYQVVEIGELPLESARALLRTGGVRGGETQLDKLIREFGNHALTLELLGNALMLFFDGNPAGAQEIAKQTQSLTEISGTADLEAQAYRFRRILRFYEQQLKPGEKATLRRLSLFQEPVEAELLADIFLGDDKECIAGSFANTQLFQLKQYLHNVSNKYKIVYSDLKADPFRFAVRPLVRELIKMSLTEAAEPSYLLRPLVEHLKIHPDAYHAWRALRYARETSFLPMLRGFLGENSDAVKSAAAGALSEIGTPEDATSILKSQPREISEKADVPTRYFRDAFKLLGQNPSRQGVLLLLLHLDLATFCYYNISISQRSSDMPYHVQHEAEVWLLRIGTKALPYIRMILDTSDEQLRCEVGSRLESVTKSGGAFLAQLPMVVKRLRFHCLKILLEIGGQDGFDEALLPIPDEKLGEIEDAFRYGFALDLAWKMKWITKMPFRPLQVVHDAELFFSIPAREPLKWLTEMKSIIKATKVVKQHDLGFAAWHSQTPFGVAKADVPIVFIAMKIPAQAKGLSDSWGFEFASPFLPSLLFRVTLSQEPLNLADNEDRALILAASKTLDDVTLPYHQIISKGYDIGAYHGTRAVIGLYSAFNLAVIFAVRISDIAVTFSFLAHAPAFEFPGLSVKGNFKELEKRLFQDPKVKWYNAIFEKSIASFQLCGD